MGEYLNKEGLTRFKEKLLTEVDNRIATGGGGSTSDGDVPTKEEILEGASRVSDVEVDPSIATIEALQTAVAKVESNLNTIESNIDAVESKVTTKLENSTVHIVETWKSGDSFYRKYSDGWIEQGGKSSAKEDVNPTITFQTPFTATPKVTFGWEKNDGLTDSSQNVTLYNISTTGFRFHQGMSTTVICHWYACGY